MSDSDDPTAGGGWGDDAIEEEETPAPAPAPAPAPQQPPGQMMAQHPGSGLPQAVGGMPGAAPMMHRQPMQHPGMMAPGGPHMRNMPPMGMTGVPPGLPVGPGAMQRPGKRPWQPDTMTPVNLAEPASKQAALQRAAQVAAQVATAPAASVGRGLHRVVPAWMVKATEQKKQQEQAQAQTDQTADQQHPAESHSHSAASSTPAVPAAGSGLKTPDMPSLPAMPASATAAVSPSQLHHHSTFNDSPQARTAGHAQSQVEDPYSQAQPAPGGQWHAPHPPHPHGPAAASHTDPAASAHAWGSEAGTQRSTAPRGRSLLGKAPPSLLGKPPAPATPYTQQQPMQGYQSGGMTGANHSHHIQSEVAPSASSTFELAKGMTSAPPPSNAAAAAAAAVGGGDDADGDGWGAPGASGGGMGWGSAPPSSASVIPSSHTGHKPAPAPMPAPVSAPAATSRSSTGAVSGKHTHTDDHGRPVVRLAAGSSASAPSPKVVFHPISKPTSGPESAAFRGVVFPKDGSFVASARAHLDKVGVWWPQRDGRRHFWVYPTSESERPAYKGLMRDLTDRDRALVIPAGDGVHVFHVIPPTPGMLRKKVVASQHRTHLTVVYGRETKR